VEYDKCISTLPLDIMCEWAGRSDLTSGLHYSSTHVIGLGIRGTCPHDTKCWLYYPEDDCPFYRCTIFSNYAEANCPSADTMLPTICKGDGSPANEDEGTTQRGGPYWSLMFEVSESARFKPVSMETVKIGASQQAWWPRVVLETILGSLNTKLHSASDDIVSIYHRRIERGYPTPSVDRDASCLPAMTFLQQEGSIWSRGRFGSWKYEVGNQDHSLMLGVEAVDNILYGSPELTLTNPNLVNKVKDAAGNRQYEKKS